MRCSEKRALWIRIFYRSGRIYYAEVNLKLGGNLLRATCQHEDMRNAIVDAKNELQSEIKKFKDKRRDLSRQAKE
jgi:ribosome-associated translation inhibitor RaiA